MDAPSAIMDAVGVGYDLLQTKGTGGEDELVGRRRMVNKAP